jgi:uncharacterized protein (TIGR02058 family)
MPGLKLVLPNNDINNMKVNVRLAVPADKEKLELDVVRAELPYGKVSIEVIDGGMLTTSGIVLADKEDKNDLVYVVVASVEVGF